MTNEAVRRTCRQFTPLLIQKKRTRFITLSQPGLRRRWRPFLGVSIRTTETLSDYCPRHHCIRPFLVGSDQRWQAEVRPNWIGNTEQVRGPGGSGQPRDRSGRSWQLPSGFVTSSPAAKVLPDDPRQRVAHGQPHSIRFASLPHRLSFLIWIAAF